MGTACIRLAGSPVASENTLNIHGPQFKLRSFNVCNMSVHFLYNKILTRHCFPI